MRFLTALFLITLTFLPAAANPPRQRAVVQVPVNQFLATQFGNYGAAGYGNGLLTLPTYGAGYQPGVTDESVRALTAAVKELNATLQRIVGPAGGQEKLPPPAAKEPTGNRGAQIILAKCAACHDKKVSDMLGGKVTLLDGDKIVCSPEVALDAIDQMYSGRMPKAKQGQRQEDVKLSDQDVEQVIQYLGLMARATRQAQKAKQ